MSKPSITNCPNTFFIIVHSFNCMNSLNEWQKRLITNHYSLIIAYTFACVQIRHTPFQVVIAVRSHLFPFRTEKLSSLAPMVLQCGRVGSRLLLSRASDFERFLRLFCFLSLILSCIICFLEILCSFMKKNERKTCSYNIFYYFCSQIHKTLNN